jgi:hypothetical protein
MTRETVASLTARVTELEARLDIYQRALTMAFAAADRPDPFAPTVRRRDHLRVIAGSRDESRARGISGAFGSAAEETAPRAVLRAVPKAAEGAVG